VSGVSKIGILLVQLGTPDQPTRGAVRQYLREFLEDPRVVEVPRWKWWFILRFLVLPRRSGESAAKYARIWDPGTGSPLLHITRLQAAGLAKALPNDFIVRFGMRYGNPSIDRAVRDFCQNGVDRLVILPLYPQYSAASTGSACDRVFDALSRERYMPSIRIVPPFYAHRGYIESQATLVRAAMATMHRIQKFIFSFHGYPADFVNRGDPYQRHVESTAQMLASELKLPADQWLITYQSRFRRQVWLQPYTEETLCNLARQGTRRILIASPGFTTDCLETIDEIGYEAAEAFRRAGGEELVRCPCLNDHPMWIEAMRQIVLQESAAWYPRPAGMFEARSDRTVRVDDDSTILHVEKRETQP
jgi:ferrochelatase